MQNNRQRLGQRGEEIACKFLSAKGYEILSRNWRCNRVELDIVARDSQTIVFCEVKTRQSSMFGLPAEAITRLKRENLRRAALLWLSSSAQKSAPLRFDVIAVTFDAEAQPHITHIRGIDL